MNMNLEALLKTGCGEVDWIVAAQETWE